MISCQSFDVVKLDLGLLVQGQNGMATLKNTRISLVLCGIVLGSEASKKEIIGCSF